jgi:hypothetical protein
MLDGISLIVFTVQHPEWCSAVAVWRPNHACQQMDCQSSKLHIGPTTDNNLIGLALLLHHTHHTHMTRWWPLQNYSCLLHRDSMITLQLVTFSSVPWDLSFCWWVTQPRKKSKPQSIDLRLETPSDSFQLSGLSSHHCHYFCGPQLYLLWFE